MTSAVYVPHTTDRLFRAYCEAYKGAKIKQEDWDNRNPAGPFLTAGKTYAILRSFDYNGYVWVEMQDDYGRFTMTPGNDFEESDV